MPVCQDASANTEEVPGKSEPDSHGNGTIGITIGITTLKGNIALLSISCGISLAKAKSNNNIKHSSKRE